MEETLTRTNFIWDAIDQDLAEGRYTQVHTRFLFRIEVIHQQLGTSIAHKSVQEYFESFLSLLGTAAYAQLVINA